ncbi:MAG TPA: alpha/beta fold hydrolase [Chitinophagaceae bacterium]|nr:alpha/beta fold hydrolase [Chitinophagaceae bacterium]
MKKNCFFLLVLFSFGSATVAQVNKFTGSWVGSINAGVEFRVVFHIREDGQGGFVSTADSPDQSAYGLKCDSTTITGNQVIIKIINLNASYTGELVNDSTIEGAFLQQAEFPLTLTKTDKTEEINIRTQTPKPPFPYKMEELQYSSADGSLSYGATITIPQGTGPFPAVLLLTRSGPQDRDETILGHKLFAVIADHLTKKGFIVLRTDDRGVGKSTGVFELATSEDFAADAGSGVDYLLSRPEVDKKRIGLIGHSEGGMIAPMVAVKRKDISFIVLLAGPGVKIIELMAEQNEAIARSAGLSEAALKEIKPLFKNISAAILRAPDSATAIRNVSVAVETWSAGRSNELLKELHFDIKEDRTSYATEMVNQFQSPWFRYFINFDPQPWLEKLNCKVLALNGDKDIQVISAQNLPGIEAALKRSTGKNYEVKELKGLNHLFQSCKKCTVDEYGELEETVSPIVLDILSGWLEKNVK